MPECIQFNEGESFSNGSSRSFDLSKDDDSRTTSAKNHLREAKMLIAKKRAAEMAMGSAEQMVQQAREEDKFGGELKKFTKLNTELRTVNAAAELELLNILEELDQYDKLRLIFHVFDQDNSSNISALELANILQLIRSTRHESCEEATRAANLSVMAHDSDCNGCLDIEEFLEFIESIGKFLEKTVDEIAYFLIMEITSHYDYQFILDEVLNLEEFTLSATSSVHERRKSCPLRKPTQIDKARLFILFRLLSALSGNEGNGEERTVQFPSIIGAMAPISKHMDKEFRMLLFYVEDDKEKYGRTLDYPDFLDFFEMIVAASPPELTRDYIVNVMTAHLCTDTTQTSIRKDSMKSLFHQHSFLESTPSSPISYDDKEAIRHLFNLWDTDGDGSLDTSELYLGLRKFYQSKDRDETMSETLSIMKKNHNEGGTSHSPTLTIEQFESILVGFTAEAGVELCVMVDFMYMETVAKSTQESKSNVNEEMQYVKKEMQCRRKSNIISCVSNIYHGLAEEKVQVI